MRQEDAAAIADTFLAHHLGQNPTFGGEPCLWQRTEVVLDHEPVWVAVYRPLSLDGRPLLIDGGDLRVVVDPLSRRAMLADGYGSRWRGGAAGEELKGAPRPSFRDREKQRQQALKAGLFSAAACRPGRYNGRLYDFCLADECAAENLHPALRAEALRSFGAARIQWHGGRGGLPSNHLCDSQIACVNALWPLARDPALLAAVFGRFLPELAEPLPFAGEPPLDDGAPPLVAFEWLGARNYLGERGWGTRGANGTSPDFALRFRRRDGRVQLVLGEWKYTERYGARLPAPERLNPRRLAAYRAAFARWRERQPGLPPYEAFFVEPFYQLLRLTLLAQELERAGEQGAQVVSVAHVAPRANRELVSAQTSPALAGYGAGLGAVWSALAPPGRFTPIASEDLLEAAADAAPAPLRAWADDLLRRYGWWRTAG